MTATIIGIVSIWAYVALHCWILKMCMEVEG